MKPLIPFQENINFTRKVILVLRDKWNVKYLSGLGFYLAKDNKVENTQLFCVIWKNENSKYNGNRILLIEIDRT